MLLNASTLNSTTLNGTARSGTIYAKGSVLAAFIVSAFISVTQPAFASTDLAIDSSATAQRVVLPIGNSEVTTITASEGGRVLLPVGYGNLATEATAVASVTRYVAGSVYSLLSASAGIAVERFVTADAALDISSFAVGKRIISASGISEVLGIVASNGQRNALGIARVDLDMTADNLGTITYTYPKVDANIALVVDGAISVQQPAFGSASMSLATNDVRASKNARSIADADMVFRHTAPATIERFVKAAPISVLSTTVTGRASNTVYTNASAYITFFYAVDGVVPSWLVFETDSLALATKIHAAKAEISTLTTDATGYADVTRHFSAKATIALDAYGSAALKLTTGGFLQDGYGDTATDFSAATDDRLVLRYTGGLSLIEFSADAIAGQTMVVRGAASLTQFYSTANYLAARDAKAETTVLSTGVSGTAVRLARANGETGISGVVNAYPSRIRTVSVQSSLAFDVSGEGKLAEKAAGDTSLTYSVAGYARQIQRGYGIAELGTEVSSTATRIVLASAEALFTLYRVDATALSNLTMPASYERSFTIQSTLRGIIVPEQNRTFDA